MSFWIFKTASQDIYPDQHGQSYVYDNRHSIRVGSGDSFIYLDKRNNQYAFTGHGTVKRVTRRAPNQIEGQKPRVRTIYKAEIVDYQEYTEPVDIRPNSPTGRQNRFAIGLVSALQWGVSMPQIEQVMYEAILELVYDSHAIPIMAPDPSEYEVPDRWAYVKKRHVMSKFRETVRNRHNWTCLICGTTVRQVIDVAHISPYAADVKNRANPANGIALCGFCHKAFDRNIIKIASDGHLTILTQDIVAQFLGSRVQAIDRISLMSGVDLGLIEARFNNNIE